MRLSLATLACATCLPFVGHAAEVSSTLSFGRVGSDGTFTRLVDTSARFRLGGAADLTARGDFARTSDGATDADYVSAGVGTTFGDTSGALDFGRPRSILEVGPLPDPARFSANASRGTFRPLAAEIALERDLGTGVRIIAERGALQLGTSYHNVDEDEDGVLGVAGRYDLAMGGLSDSMTVYGGVESDGTVERYRLGTEVTLGRAVAAVDLLRTGDEGINASQVSLGLAVTEAVMFGVTGVVESDGDLLEPVSRLGVGASVSLESGTFLRGGFDTRTSEDYAIDVEIGFQF